MPLGSLFPVSAAAAFDDDDDAVTARRLTLEDGADGTTNRREDSDDDLDSDAVSAANMLENTPIDIAIFGRLKNILYLYLVSRSTVECE